MQKKPLKFKVDGGLKKISDFYSRVENDKGAIEAYWQNPAALLQELVQDPAREIRISSGYKKLADSLDKLNFQELHHSFAGSREDDDARSVEEKALTSLWHTVAGYGSDMQFGGPKSNFTSVATVTVTVTMTMTMTMTSTVTVTTTTTVTVTSGFENKKKPPKKPDPDAPKFSSHNLGVQKMSRYAQSVADHVGWFS